MRQRPYILFTLCTLLFSFALSGCKDDLLLLWDNEEDIKAGEEVMFTTYVPGKPVVMTRATAAETAFQGKMDSFQVARSLYSFTVEMYQEGESAMLGSATYCPDTTLSISSQGDTTVVYNDDGTLKATTTPLYWPGNTKRYGFKATAGTDRVADDQSTKEALLANDRLLGYAFEPLWDEEGDTAVDRLDTINVRTSKEWYLANKTTKGMAPGSEDVATWYKKIPLYLRHQCALVTIRLKAGLGVDSTDLSYDKAVKNIHTEIFSYGGGVPTAIRALATKDTVDYSPTQRGVQTTSYTAVVEPYNYLTNADNDTIAKINLSGQRFTFYASNDYAYNSDQTGAGAMAGYNLQAGQHLVITATLGRGSRKILITAYVEDWTETVTTSIVDDYGQAGDPIQINTRQELYDFLTSERNKQGNVAIIVPNSLNLDTDTTSWDTPLPLNCTLNMAGATFDTRHQVFSTISQSGNLVNGTIRIDSASVKVAVADSLYGTIERVNVTAVDGKSQLSYATRAGLVDVNSGSILGCESELPVKAPAGSAGYVGGIAARSVYATIGSGATMPIIDGCRVNASVGGDNESSTRGGGIVGEAVGRVTNNTFEYGITIGQNADNYKSIIFAKADGSETLRAYGNSWPTRGAKATSNLAGPNNYPGATYDHVIESQAELALLFDPQYNKDTLHYRLSKSFTVTKAAGWTFGRKVAVDNDSSGDNVKFKLEGNNMTITTDAMLFPNIKNDISNLTVCLSDSLKAVSPDGQDAIAPLGYAVMNGATLSNIKVKGGPYPIQAATVGGIVVWAYEGAKIVDCQCKAKIQTWVSRHFNQTDKKYAGGIVGCAAEATISRCTFHSMDNTLYRNTADTCLVTTVGTDNMSVIYYGGILGGTVAKELSAGTEQYPKVLITDCVSWFSTSDSSTKGAIVGYAKYEVGDGSYSGMDEGCQGNWWSTSSDGIGTWYGNVSGTPSQQIDKILGKRNAVAPTQNNNYENEE